jgi:hypothetical protein
MTPSEKRTQTLIKRYGSLEAYKAQEKIWRSKGGKATAKLGKSGFQTMSREDKSAAGKLGRQAMIRKLMEEAKR